MKRFFAIIMAAVMVLAIVAVVRSQNAYAAVPEVLAKWTIGTGGSTKTGVFASRMGELRGSGNSAGYASGNLFGGRGYTLNTGLYFYSPTEGYENIRVSGILRAAGTSARYLTLQVGKDNVWTDVCEIDLGSGTAEVDTTFDVLMPVSVADSEQEFSFRWQIFKNIARNGTTLAVTAPLYFKTHITITGTPIVPPPTDIDHTTSIPAVTVDPLTQDNLITVDGIPNIVKLPVKMSNLDVDTMLLCNADYLVNYDPTVLEYCGVNIQEAPFYTYGGKIPGTNEPRWVESAGLVVANAAVPGNLVWVNASAGYPLKPKDGETIGYLYFRVIGNAGDVSPVTIVNRRYNDPTVPISGDMMLCVNDATTPTPAFPRLTSGHSFSFANGSVTVAGQHAHTFGAVQSNPPGTCTTPGGGTYHVCTSCGETEVLTADALDPNNHNWGAWTTTTPATCMATGLQMRTCGYNNTHTETSTLPVDPNNHVGAVEQFGAAAATCTEGGFTAAVAETVNADGSDGSYRFTVTLTKGNESRTSGEKTLTIAKTPYDRTADNAAIAAAKTAIESEPYTVIQYLAGTEAAAKGAVEGIIRNLPALSGVAFVVNPVNPNAFIPAVEGIAGTEAEQEGTNGRYRFTVTLNKGKGAEVVTEQRELTVTAKRYDPTEDNNAIEKTEGALDLYFAAKTFEQLEMNSEEELEAAVSELTRDIIIGEFTFVSFEITDGAFTPAQEETPALGDWLDGSYVFNIRLTRGAGDAVSAGPYTIAINHTAYGAHPDDEAILAVKGTIEDNVFIAVEMAALNAEAALREYVQGIVNTLKGESGVACTVVTDLSWTPATAGVLGSPTTLNGVNGSYKFKVTLEKGDGFTVDTVLLSFMINATKRIQVSFDVDGGSAVSPILAQAGLTYNGVVSFPANPTKMYKTFEGWYTNFELTEGPVTASTVITQTESHTLYAKWADINVTVTLVVPAGAAFGGTTSFSRNSGQDYGAELDAVASKSRHDFMGWYTTPEIGGAKIISTDTVTVISNQTLYARMRPTELIDFECVGDLSRFTTFSTNPGTISIAAPPNGSNALKVDQTSVSGTGLKTTDVIFPTAIPANSVVQFNINYDGPALNNTTTSNNAVRFTVAVQQMTNATTVSGTALVSTSNQNYTSPWTGVKTVRFTPAAQSNGFAIRIAFGYSSTLYNTTAVNRQAMKVFIDNVIVTPTKSAVFDLDLASSVDALAWFNVGENMSVGGDGTGNIAPISYNAEKQALQVINTSGRGEVNFQLEKLPNLTDRYTVTAEARVEFTSAIASVLYPRLAMNYSGEWWNDNDPSPFQRFTRSPDGMSATIKYAFTMPRASTAGSNYLVFFRNNVPSGAWTDAKLYLLNLTVSKTRTWNFDDPNHQDTFPADDFTWDQSRQAMKWVNTNNDVWPNGGGKTEKVISVYAGSLLVNTVITVQMSIEFATAVSMGPPQLAANYNGNWWEDSPSPFQTFTIAPDNMSATINYTFTIPRVTNDLYIVIYKNGIVTGNGAVYYLNSVSLTRT